MQTSLWFIGWLGLALCAAPCRAQVSMQDSLALVALFHATGGPDWVPADPEGAGSWRAGPNWLEGPVRTWHSVTVTDGRVTRIYTEFLQMEGALPPELGDLTALTELLITHDLRLTGALPEAIGNLATLTHLAIYGTGIDGPIPSTIGALTELETLELPFNALSGSIPPEIGALRALEDLYLMDNALEGAVPESLAELVHLRSLFLDGNPGLTGPLPRGLMDLPDLHLLNIDGTGLCGPTDPAFQDWLFEVAGVVQTSCPVNTDAQPAVTAAFGIAGLFPNPARDAVTIRFAAPAAGTATVEVVDLLGRRVTVDRVDLPGGGTHDAQLVLPELVPGTYVVRLSSARQWAITRVIVVR